MIVDLIKSIVQSLPVTDSPISYPNFIHGEKDYQNLLAEGVNFDLQDVTVFLDQPISSNDDIKKSGYIEETYPLSMAFLKRSELDFTPDQHQVLIDQMRVLRKRFLNRLTSNSNVKSVSSVQTTDAINVFDVNLSGIVMKLTVVTFNNDSSCQ
jgi:hypothetical protein